MSNLAVKVNSRVIHLGLDITLFPPGHPVSWERLGGTDEAMAIGRGLVHEAVLLLQNACEAEGFRVEIKVAQVVY